VICNPSVAAARLPYQLHEYRTTGEAPGFAEQVFVNCPDDKGAIEEALDFYTDPLISEKTPLMGFRAARTKDRQMQKYSLRG